jgi:hypothetical protein
VVTAVGAAASAEARFAASAIKTGPLCATGLMSGTRAALVVLKLAATLAAGAAVEVVPEKVSCAWATHAAAHIKNDDTNNLFMISP